MPPLEHAASDLFATQFRHTAYSLDQFWRFVPHPAGGAWQPIPPATIRAELTVILESLGEYPSARMLSAVLDHVRLGLARPAAQWNQFPALLPCLNGVLHLSTGQLAPHQPGQFLARSLPVAFDPAAACPVWEAFLLSTVPAAAGFLQEFAGLALTFDTRHEAALWLYGPPGSGKSTFLVGLQAMLGDRSGQLDLLALSRRRLPAAHLFGRSLLVSSEQPLRDLEHDHLLNALISGEPLVVEDAARQPDVLTLRAKWIWALVSLPRLTRATSGLYRRVHLVPFPPRAEADRDPALKDRLAREGSGLLNWALAGLARLRQRGRLAPPPLVAGAGQRFAQSNDLVAQFVAEACLPSPAARESASRLYAAYVGWCRRSGLRPDSTNLVAADWERLGFVRRRVDGRSVWFGLELQPELSNQNHTKIPDHPVSDATAATAATNPPTPSANTPLLPPNHPSDVAAPDRPPDQ